MDKYTKVEDTPKLLTPIQPSEAISAEKFMSIMREKLNETIEVVNTLREEIIKIKKK